MPHKNSYASVKKAVGTIDEEDLRRLKEIRDEMWDLAEEALELIPRGGARDRAKGYWYAHILGALNKDESGFMGGSMVDMTETINELEGEESEEE